MIKLNNLEKPILTLHEKPILDLGDSKKILDYKSALISSLELHQKPGEGIKAYELGGRFIKTKDEIEISQEDIEFLKKVVESSSIFVSVVVGRLTDYLNNAKERSTLTEPNNNNQVK